jgi:hypothetical protein
MLPATPVVNSSIEDYVTPLIWPCNEHPIGSNRLVLQCNGDAQMHNPPNRER